MVNVTALCRLGPSADMLTDILLQEIAGLRDGGYKVELIEGDGFANIILDDYPLPPMYNKQSTRLLLRIPISYPNGNPDMFWTAPDLLCEDGRTPTNADSLEDHLGQQWRRFSWHPQGWNPSIGNLSMYLEFVNNGLARAVKSNQ
ncbi:MAG: hypothetical protein HRF47_09075 [Chloroflexota bacterium]